MTGTILLFCMQNFHHFAIVFIQFNVRKSPFARLPFFVHRIATINNPN